MNRGRPLPNQETTGNDDKGFWSVMGIGGALGALCSIVGTPIAVNAMRFTASGISAGSLVASIMSAEAVAAGGGVAAGGFTATMQAVGAAGLFAAGPVLPCVIVGSLVVVGALVVVEEKPLGEKDLDEEGCVMVTTLRMYVACMHLLVQRNRASIDPDYRSRFQTFDNSSKRKNRGFCL
mmetsp:Transcript_6083/g.13589  ORF Transcript_6083/g.13589 Transcript_6083/m.13589 type:complete len:179 (+) Transcript_6083:1598-2134(+)